MPQHNPFPPRRLEPEPAPPPPRPDSPRIRLGRLYGRFRGLLLVALGFLIAFSGMLAFDMTKPPPQRLTQRDINAAVSRAMASATPAPSWASQAYAMIRPSLVRINVRTSAPGAEPEAGVGSGVVVEESGTILTSLHVVRNATDIRVVFADGTESPARIVVSQPENDLAVLRPAITPDDLVAATLGGGVNIGDEVFAAGSPFGVTNSLTSGVVSGLGREYRNPRTGETLKSLIQFDAAVNPGSSGGPLVDRYGEVVGIVTGLLNPTGQEVFIGIGLAVPIETAGGALGSPPF